MENDGMMVGTFKDILLPFGIFYGNSAYFVVIWNIFPPFWYLVPNKIWQPWLRIGYFMSGYVRRRQKISILRSMDAVG
jgi:hypothetical protein